MNSVHVFTKCVAFSFTPSKYIYAINYLYEPLVTCMLHPQPLTIVWCSAWLFDAFGILTKLNMDNTFISKFLIVWNLDVCMYIYVCAHVLVYVSV